MVKANQQAQRGFEILGTAVSFVANHINSKEG